MSVPPSTPAQYVVTDSDDVIFAVQRDWSFCILSGFLEKGLFDMQSNAAARFDVARWTVDIYCGWPPCSPNQGLRWIHASIRVCSYSCMLFFCLMVLFCLCVRVFVVTMYVYVRVVMFYNDRFTPSQDSANVHMLRLLSPYPNLSCFSSVCQVWAGDKLCGGVSVCVTLNSRHTHAVRCQSHGLDGRLSLTWRTTGVT